MKKIISIALVIMCFSLVLVLFTACGDKNTDGETTTQSTTQVGSSDNIVDSSYDASQIVPDDTVQNSVNGNNDSTTTGSDKKPSGSVENTTKKPSSQKPVTNNSGSSQKPVTNNSGSTQKPTTNNSGSAQVPSTTNKPQSSTVTTTQAPSAGSNGNNSGGGIVLATDDIYSGWY